MSIEPYALQDAVMLVRLREIIRSHYINVVVETGIDKGWSTIAFSGLTDLVIGIDIDPGAIGAASRNANDASRDNILFLLDNSPDALRKLRPILPFQTLYFLDAHWGAYWPLLDEIAAIGRGAGVIVFHDIFVPDHPELGFDSYGGQRLDYGYVRLALNRWSPTHRIEYNERADCPVPRGVAYVFPS